MNTLRKLLLGLLLVPSLAGAASVTYIGAATNPSSAASATYTTASFTPTAGRVQFGACIVSGTLIDPPTITNSLGGTYTVIDAVFQSTNNPLYAFVADQTSTASAQTVTIDVTGDNGTGGFCEIFEADITRTGSGALKQAIAVQGSQAGPSTPAVTFGSAVTTTNITFACVLRTGSNPAAVTEPSGWTEGVDTGYDLPSIGLECAYRNSGFTGTTITWGSSESAYAAFAIELDVSPASLPPPSFSVAPAVGTLTSTTAQITATPDQNATWYGIACADGETANASQVKAGTTCSGGAAIAAFNKSVTGADSQTFTGLSESTAYDTFHVLSNANGDSSAATLADVTTQASAAPSFTTGPTVSAAANGYTVAGTISCTGTCTVYAVACALGDAAPTADEIETGDCGGGNDAVIAASEAWTTTVADSFALTASNKPPRLNVYVSGSNGTDDTSVVPFLSKDRTARSGYAIVGMSSHSASGICGYDSYFDPDCDDGSVIEYETTRNNHSNCGIAIAATGLVSYYDKTDGQDTGSGESGDSSDDAIDDCAGQISFELSYEYGGSATTGLYTAPSGVGNFATDDTGYINNSAPTCAPEDPAQVVLNLDEAMEVVDLGDLGNCEDEDGDELTYSLDVLLAGTSLSGTGDREWGGTPTVVDSDGQLITVTVTDTPGDSTTYQYTAFVVEPSSSWEVPDCQSLSLSACSDLIVEAAPWREDDPGLFVDGYTCGTGQPFLSIADQGPAAGVNADPFDPVSVHIVGAIVPDLSGMTEAQAIAAIEALCP